MNYNMSKNYGLCIMIYNTVDASTNSNNVGRLKRCLYVICRNPCAGEPVTTAAEPASV